MLQSMKSEILSSMESVPIFLWDHHFHTLKCIVPSRGDFSKVSRNKARVGHDVSFQWTPNTVN